MSIGERIKQLRALYRVNLQDLADSVGISISTLSRIERGTIKDLKLSVILKLIKFFNITFEFLISGEYHTSKLQISKQIICNLYTLLLQSYEPDGKENDQHKIEMIDLSDESSYEFIKTLFEYTGRKDIPREIIPYIIGVRKQRVSNAFKKYRFGE